MAKAQLDSLDYKILKTLSTNGRKPFLEIARECNVSGAAIHQRIQKLMAMGVLRGSECLINPASVGYDTCAYIGFFLKDVYKRQGETNARDIARQPGEHITEKVIKTK